MAKDLYKVLGVTKSASDEEIRKAYRALAKKHHPDLNLEDKSAAERFKEISAAYDILGDPDKRKRYNAGEIDETGQERPERHFYRQYAEGAQGGKYQRGPWQRGAGAGAGPEDLGDIGDIFADLFGRGARGGADPFAQTRARGGDVRYTLKVPFLEAARGGPKRITLPDGSALDLTIPPGTTDGQTLRLRGRGAPGHGHGAQGDAYVTIDVEPHPGFERKGNDIYGRTPISIDEAVLGAKIEAETIGGPVSVKVPPGSNTGSILRLKGRGIAPATGAPGDHYVRLEVVLPKEPDAELRAFLEQWRAKHAHNPRKGGS